MAVELAVSMICRDIQRKNRRNERKQKDRIMMILNRPLIKQEYFPMGRVSNVAKTGGYHERAMERDEGKEEIMQSQYKKKIKDIRIDCIFP